MAVEQFLFETYRRHMEEGIAAHERKDLREARYRYLMAARYLLELARRGDASLGDIRKKQAERLIAAAGQVEKEAPPPALGEAEGAAAEASRWRVTPREKIRLEDVKGLEDVKAVIRRRIVYPFLHPEVAGRYGKRAGGGVLLYGPPGTGKTMLARAVAGEVDAAFYSVRSSDIMSKWVGDAEKNMRGLFDAAGREERSVVFMDEVEALVGKRGRGSTVMDRLIPEFLSLVDGVEGDRGRILLLGATNRPWDMDEAALRPGRFDELIYVPPPDAEARHAIIEKELEGVPMDGDMNLVELAEHLEGFTGADLVGLVQRMTDLPYEREIRTGEQQILTRDDLEQAVKSSRPSVTRKMLARYEKFGATGE